MCYLRLESRQVRCGSWAVVCQPFSSFWVLCESYPWWLGSRGFLSAILVKIPCQPANITDNKKEKATRGWVHLWLVMLRYDLQKSATFSGWDTEINTCLSGKPNPEEKAGGSSFIKITIPSHIAQITCDLIKVARWFWLGKFACHGL